MGRIPWGWLRLGGCLALGISPPTQAINLTDVATLIGADTFYNQGYTGTRSILGNVEAGHVSNTHQVFDGFFGDGRKRVAQQVRFVNETTFTVTSHATQVGGVMVADGLLNDGSPSLAGPGIAFGAQLWSGQIAIDNPLTGGSFSISGNSLLFPLMAMGQVGINDAGVVGGAGAKRVDVVNSSWGGMDNTGNTVINALYDYLACRNGLTMVVAAGNAGQGPGTVGTPANSWNVISVGATNTTLIQETVSSFSSGGPTGSFNTTGTRTKPDIIAPGVGIVMPTTGTPTSFTTASGTSFAAPIVAASAGLLIDLGKDTARSTDPRLVKAVLLNSAVKLPGWHQDTTTRLAGGSRANDTVINITPLDNSQGAGRVDLDQAFTQYTAVPGGAAGSQPSSGYAPGSVGAVGWSLNTVGQNAPVDYLINAPLLGQSTLTATLAWFMDRSVSGFNHLSTNPFGSTRFANESFDDLDLFLFETDSAGQFIGNEIAASSSGWDPASPDDPSSGLDSVEHLHFVLPKTGRYALRVSWAQEWFDFDNGNGFDLANTELFALAWSATSVPEPASGVVLIVGCAFLRLTRRR